MKRILLYASLWIAAVSSAFASTTRIIPVAGHLAGANGTVWTTDVTLTNNTAAAMNVDLIFRLEESAPRTRSIRLAAGASTLLENAVAPSKFPGNNPSSWLGHLEIRAPGEVAASARIFTPGRNGGTFGSTYEAFDPTVLSTSGVIAGLVSSNRFRSNVAFTNPNDHAVEINYALRNASGNVTASRTLGLPAHSTRQLAMSDTSSNTNDTRLSLFWSANGRAYAVGSIVDNRSGDPTSAPSVSRDATSLFFPFVGRSAGGNATFWSTSASIAATSGVTGSLTFAFTDNAAGRTYTRTVLLPALGNVTTEDVNDFVGAPAGLGSLRVTSTTPLAATVRVFNTLEDGSTFGSSVLAQDAVVRSSNVSIDGVRRDNDYRLNVAVANENSSDVTGRVRLFDEGGFEVESHPFRVQPGKAAQLALHGALAITAGELRVESENGLTVTAVASNIDNVTGDTVQREPAQESERQNELEISLSSRTAAIGTPVFFGLKRAGADVIAVNWQFGDGSSAAGSTVNHSYSSAGGFDVSVEVTLAGGAIIRDREDLRITGNAATPPAAIDFTYTPAAPAPGQQVVFTATGATNGGVFKWNFPGDVRPVGNTVTFTFPSAGSFQVEVEIEHGATRAEVTRIVTVGGASTGGPTAGPIDFVYSPAAPQAGQEVMFTATGWTGGGTFKWKFPGNVRKFGSTASFTFPANGAYEVEVEVEHGSVLAELTKIVSVGDATTVPGPGTGALNFTFSPQSPAAGQEVTFTASGSTGGGIYKWKFPGDVRKLGGAVTFTFASAGSYGVELEIEHGTIVAEIEKVVVVSGANGGDPVPSALDFSFSPAAPRAGQTVTFTASGNAGGGTYEWEFPGGVRKTGTVVTYTFTAAGSYEVELELEHSSIDAKVEKRISVAP